MVTEAREGGKVANKTQMTSMEDIKTEDPKVVLNLVGGIEITGEEGKVANKTQMTSMEDIKTEDPKVVLNLVGGIEITGEEGKEANKGAPTTKEELDSEEESTVAANSGEGAENNKKAEMEDKSMDSSDQESPRGVLEIPVSGAESDGGSSSSENSPSDQSTAVESHWKRLTSRLLLKKKRDMKKLLTFPQATTVSDAGLHRRLAKIQYDEDQIECGGPKSQVWRWRSSWRSSGRQELVAGTDNFSSGTEENKESLKVEPADKSMDNSDQESPRGVLEISISDVEADGGGSISKSSSLDQSIMVESHNFHWRSLISGLLLRKKRSIMRLSTFPPAMPSGTRLQRTLAKMQCDEDRVEGEGSLSEIPKASPPWRSFDCQELAAATNNFSPDKLIGKGGHAEVYKGCLPDGQLVAVKKLTKGDSEDRIRDFLSELGIIGHVNHHNAAQLLGFSVEEGLHLVLKFSPHGSLASVLHGSKDSLDWGIRFKIALGIAQGLLYLHEGCQRRIIHRDIKASNILLTDDYQPQISDFGLAKWLPDKWSHHIVFPIEGTFGYLAPEYFMHGIVNENTDVFAFGVLLLELITGRKAVDPSRQSLVIWAKPLLESCNMKELIDPSLMDVYSPEEARRAISAASMCIHHLSTMRPNMNWVVRLLKGEERVAEFVGREPRRRPLLFDAGDPVDYTCSTYLDDLHRHKELAMEQ